MHFVGRFQVSHPFALLYCPSVCNATLVWRAGHLWVELNTRKDVESTAILATVYDVGLCTAVSIYSANYSSRFSTHLLCASEWQSPFWRCRLLDSNTQANLGHKMCCSLDKTALRTCGSAQRGKKYAHYHGINLVNVCKHIADPIS
jgi:hypothetical protein